MTTPAADPDDLKALHRALEGALDGPPGGAPALPRAADLAALLQAKQAQQLRPPSGTLLRFGGHLDVRADVLVHVPDLGTLGLVHVLPRRELVAEARRAIDTAVQLRQLLLERAETGSTPSRALQVEVLLVVPPTASEEERQRLAATFDTIARRTQYLRLVGLNLLALPASGDPDRAALRRAFCWLLIATRKWLPKKSTTVEVPPPAWSLQLDDYRLAGTRQFAFRGGLPRLHLVHGHNGSGKTTLVEAIELLLTGRVDRLDKGQLEDYHAAIRHRPRSAPSAPASAAKAALTLAGQPLVACTIAPTSRSFVPAQPPAEGLFTAQSFRIDQAFMNDLVRADGPDRATLFLEAFAPHERPWLASLRSAERAFAEARKKLPPALLPATPPDTTEAWLLWCEQTLAPFDTKTASAPPPLGWAALLPLGETELAQLAPARPALAPLRERLRGAPGSAALALLRQLDGELAALRDTLPAMAEDLRVAVRIFEEFADWQAAGQVRRGGSFAQDLQRWLELTALADLARKHAELLQTLHAASQAGWAPRPADAAALPPLPVDPRQAETVRACAGTLQQELNDARERLRGWQGEASPTGSTAAAATAGERRHVLVPTEAQALDRAGAWLPATAGPTPLGTIFQEALARNQVQTLAGGAVGSAGGLKQPLAQARALLATVDAVLARPKAEWITSNAALGRVTAVVEASAVLRQARTQLTHSLFAKLAAEGPGADADADDATRLQNAVNELLALATPARWEYSDIGLRSRFGTDGTPALGLAAQGDSRADLMLNTAELSAMSLVLFLLLAPRVANPLRLLVLDDPLQNMDEMMVCTLARALAALLAIYPQDWSLLAFFHGMEDLERIRDEAPAEVYHLPWARPIALPTGKPVRKRPTSAESIGAVSEGSRAQRPTQKLDAALVTLAPKLVG